MASIGNLTGNLIIEILVYCNLYESDTNRVGLGNTRAGKAVSVKLPFTVTVVVHAGSMKAKGRGPKSCMC